MRGFGFRIFKILFNYRFLYCFVFFIGEEKIFVDEKRELNETQGWGGKERMARGWMDGWIDTEKGINGGREEGAGRGVPPRHSPLINQPSLSLSLSLLPASRNSIIGYFNQYNRSRFQGSTTRVDGNKQHLFPLLSEARRRHPAATSLFFLQRATINNCVNPSLIDFNAAGQWYRYD